jgi:hypothetical protein
MPRMRSLFVIAIPSLFTVALFIACNSASSNGQVCPELTSEVESQTGLALSQAGESLSCTTTADCVVAPSTSTCLQSCSAAMNKTGAAQLATAIGQINSNVCAQFASNSCPANPVPTCPTLVAACVSGSCAAITPEDAGTEDSGVPTSDDAGADAADSASADSSADGAADASDAGSDAAGEGGAEAGEVGDGSSGDASNGDGGA